MNDARALSSRVENTRAKAHTTAELRAARVAVAQARTESPLVRFILISVALLFVAAVLVVPLGVIFLEAFKGGWQVYVASLRDPNALASIRLTLIVAAIAVPLNVVFGLAASWAIAKFRFKGKSILTTLIDLPFAVSPVVAGLVFVLLFGRQGVFGPWLEARDWHIVYAVPGIVLATLFVTFPFVARELIAFMEAQGIEEEEAAISLGASGWQTYWRVTLPNIKWGLLYGIILCNARAMGEYGAVSVVVGDLQGQTNTVPLQVDRLYNGNDSAAAAFALASILVVLGLVTLVIKRIVESRVHRQVRAGQE